MDPGVAGTLLIFCVIIFICETQSYSYVKGTVEKLSHCPGHYCGRHLIQQENKSLWSSCGPCPRGFHVNGTWACVPCDNTPFLYDWLYLSFMGLIGLLLHWYSIDWAFGKTVLTARILVVHLSALFETVVSAVITLLINNPIGSLTLDSCTVQQLSDWYTLLHNPNPNYEETLHCTHEAVYPLYSIIFIHYGLSVVLLLLIRPWINMSLGIQGRNASRPIYAALYFFPLLSLLHAVMAGLVYYSYPAITILLSLMSHGYHFASRTGQGIRALVRGTVTSIRNLIIVIGHWLLHAYGIIALVIWLKPELLITLLCLVPLPTLLYIIMVRFTDPNKLHVE